MAMAASYRIRFTDLARARARSRPSLSVVEETIRTAVDNLMWNGTEAVPISELLFHVVAVEAQDYVCWPEPSGDEVILVVDACGWKDAFLEEGPFAGRKISFPAPGSE